ncbi:MAG: lamin tail domain-containing protein, partial [Nitrospiria bacterium]
DLQNEGYLLVIAGDFNDYDWDSSSRDHINSQPITNVLQIARELDPSKSSDNLINAASFAPQGIRYTAFYDANRNGTIEPQSEYTSIDHILLSPELAAKVTHVDFPHHHDPREAPDHFSVVVHLNFGDPSGGTPIVQVRIVSLLPNPSGNDNQNEEATIGNAGTQDVDLSGWKLRDLVGRTWSLDSHGTLHAGDEKAIRRNGQAMALNNNGDTIDLINPDGDVVQSVTYPSVEEGEIVIPAN